MAIAGAKEAAVAKASNGDSAAAAATVRRRAERAQPHDPRRTRRALEARSKAQAQNFRATERLTNGGTADDAGNKVAAGMKAVANLGFHRGGAAIASALSGIRGLGPEDAARVVKLYTDPHQDRAGHQPARERLTAGRRLVSSSPASARSARPLARPSSFQTRLFSNA
jgi:hypothetical protein